MFLDLSFAYFNSQCRAYIAPNAYCSRKKNMDLLYSQRSVIWISKMVTL